MDLFDTHCHLNLQAAFPDPDSAVQEALDAGVSRLAVVGIDRDTNARALDIAERHEGVCAVVGWHPNSAATFSASVLAGVREMLGHPKAVALGEIGLDYHWDLATKDQQFACLLDQLDLAIEVSKPVVFHCREAYGDLLDLLESRPKHPYLFHCFSGSREEAGRALALGGLLGFDGPLTYRKSDDLRGLLSEIPEDRFVLETDSPYMPPEPFRGKSNKPALLPLVNRAAASCRGLSEEACAELSFATARRFFGI